MFQKEKKGIQRKWQTLPSFFAFSVIYVMLLWASETKTVSFYQASLQMFGLSSFSVLLSVILIGMAERVFLSDVAKQWQGLPILLISGAILLLVFSGILKNFLP